MALTVSIASLLAVATLSAERPARAEGISTTNCLGARWSFTCMTTWRKQLSDPHIVAATEPTSDRDSESQERERLWIARCKPRIWQDELGVDRYVYAERGCEFGKYR
jgi:hypothetical protein